MFTLAQDACVPERSRELDPKLNVKTDRLIQSVFFHCVFAYYILAQINKLSRRVRSLQGSFVLYSELIFILFARGRHKQLVGAV